jgi:hypothetical protein
MRVWAGGILALTAALLLPLTAEAAKVSFRNDTAVPIVIQGTMLIRGQLTRGKPLVVAPGKTVSYDAMPAGIARIDVYDGRRPSLTVFQGTITVGADDLSFSVAPDDNQKTRAKLDPVDQKP